MSATDWPAFYRQLYTRLGLDKYLPKVLAELEHGPVLTPEPEPDCEETARRLRERAGDTIEAIGRMYGEWRDQDRMARFCEDRLSNPWSATRRVVTLRPQE